MRRLPARTALVEGLRGLKSHLAAAHGELAAARDHVDTGVRALDELGVGEIATITGLPEGTVKSRLHRARSALREHMERLHRNANLLLMKSPSVNEMCEIALQWGRASPVR